jgi:hypothetical protein
MLFGRIVSLIRSRIKRRAEERGAILRFFICRRCLQETRAVMGAAHLCPDCYELLRGFGQVEETVEHRARLAEGAGAPRSAFAGRRG